jgi:transmembrane sensor
MMTDIAQSKANVDIEAAAAAFLRRQHYEQWSSADDKRFSDWLEESPSHKAAYWRLKAAWDQTERLAALRPGSFRRSSAQKSGVLPMIVKGFVGVAAIAAVVAAIGFWGQSSGQLYTTGVGGRTTITLADGSELDLGTDSGIRTHFDANRRAVDVLKGEVFFRVTHNEALPFVVTVGGNRVIDVGTEFLVRKTPEKVQVSLIKGEAMFEADIWSTGRSVMLHPGDVALATATSFGVSRKSNRELADELGWRRGVLVFHDTRLGDAIAEFNRYNAVKMVASDPKVAALTINGTFRTNGFEQFARVARDVFGLRIERRNSGIELRN